MHSTARRLPEKDLLGLLRKPKFELWQRSNFGSVGSIALALLPKFKLRQRSIYGLVFNFSNIWFWPNVPAHFLGLKLKILAF